VIRAGIHAPLGPIALTCVAAASLTACGSAEENPPAPEPATSPPLAERPPGRLVELGGEPEGLAADPRTGLVAVALRNPDRLALVEGSSGRVVRRVPLPESARHLQLAAPGRVLAPAERADLLVEVPLPAGRPLQTSPVGDFPHDAAAARDRVVVANEGDDTVTILERGRARATLEAPKGPGGVAAAGTLAAVVGVRARRIALYDLVAERKLAEETGGVGPTHVVADEARAYVADTEGDAILVYRLRPEFGFLDRANLAGSPYGLALDRRRGLLWVTLTATNELVRLELNGGAPRRGATFPTIRQPNSVVVDERTGRVYVAGRDGSELQILGREVSR
jgi:DNA-binding beta-propeller fold protein YncE